jgi:hypothetical protein
MQLKGQQGLNGWRWIFIIEGALTCFLGIVAYWALVDFPDLAHTSWHFLNEREAKFIIDAVNRDRGDAKPEPWDLKKFLSGGLDIKIWGFALVSTCETVLQAWLLTYSDFLQHNNRHLRARILSADHPDREHGLLRRRVAMLGGTTIRIGSNRHVRNRLGWRQVPPAGTHYRFQHDPMHYRCFDHGFPLKPRCSILRCLPYHCWSEQQRPRCHVVPGQQHPRTVEACVLLCDTCRYGWCRRYRWRIDLQVRYSVNSPPFVMLTLRRFQDKPGYRPGLYACIACCLLTLIIVALITLGSWRSNKKADRGEIELEYHDEGDQKGFRYTY